MILLVILYNFDNLHYRFDYGVRIAQERKMTNKPVTSKKDSDAAVNPTKKINKVLDGDIAPKAKKMDEKTSKQVLGGLSKGGASL